MSSTNGKKKKPAVSPESAKILEQYRNASKTGTNSGATPGAAEGSDGVAPVQRPTGPAISPMKQRSGTRGK
jgi:hypothetical protein